MFAAEWLKFVGRPRRAAAARQIDGVLPSASTPCALFWIPACAGMTRHPDITAHTVIPAKAGTQQTAMGAVFT